MGRYPGVPSILDKVLRDATINFILMFICQLLAEAFTLATAVGDIRYLRGRLIVLCSFCVCVCSERISGLSWGVSFLSPRQRTYIRVIDVDLCPTGQAWFSSRSRRHAS